MPGDYTPPSRFVKTAFQKSHIPMPETVEEAVNTCFHILEGVAVPKGVVITERGTIDYTQYTAVINTATGEYFVKTYDNSQIRTASLFDHSKSTKPISLGRLNAVKNSWTLFEASANHS